MKLTNGRFSPTLFWDVNARSVDQRTHAQFIIERVLRWGDVADWRQVERQYDRRLIQRTLRQLPSLDAKSRALWLLVLGRQR